MYAKYILNYSQTQLCVSREPFPPFSTCDGFFFCRWNSALDFFFVHLHVCLICGLFCRNFFFIHRWICSVSRNLFLLTFRSYAFLPLHDPMMDIFWIVAIEVSIGRVFFTAVAAVVFIMLLKWISFNASHTKRTRSYTYWTHDTRDISATFFLAWLWFAERREQKKHTYCTAN